MSVEIIKKLQEDFAVFGDGAIYNIRDGLVYDKSGNDTIRIDFDKSFEMQSNEVREILNEITNEIALDKKPDKTKIDKKLVLDKIKSKITELKNSQSPKMIVDRIDVVALKELYNDLLKTV